MVMLIQALLSGVAQGAIYALIALGYSVIYRTLNMGHFAQGEFYMLGAFFGVWLFTKLNLPPIIVFIASGLLTSLVMLVMERLAYRPLYTRSVMGLLISTLGMQYVIQTIAKIVWGSDVKRFPPMLDDSTVYIPFQDNRIAISMQSLWVIGVCAILLLALTLFLTKTKTGLAMCAVSMNRKAAALMGVNINTVITSTFIIAAFLAAIAGVLMGPLYSVSFTMGSGIGTTALTAAVMGGFGSLPGAVLGGLLLGVVETLGALYISSAYKDLFSFIVLISILFLRPQGLFGQAKVTKV